MKKELKAVLVKQIKEKQFKKQQMKLSSNRNEHQENRLNLLRYQQETLISTEIKRDKAYRCKEELNKQIAEKKSKSGEFMSEKEKILNKTLINMITESN